LYISDKNGNGTGSEKSRKRVAAAEVDAVVQKRGVLTHSVLQMDVIVSIG